MTDDTTPNAPTYASLQNQVAALTEANETLSATVLANTVEKDRLHRIAASAICLLRQMGWEGNVSELDA